MDVERRGGRETAHAAAAPAPDLVQDAVWGRVVDKTLAGAAQMPR
jgi:hypothetical protein